MSEEKLTPSACPYCQADKWRQHPSMAGAKFIQHNESCHISTTIITSGKGSEDEDNVVVYHTISDQENIWNNFPEKGDKTKSEKDVLSSFQKENKSLRDMNDLLQEQLRVREAEKVELEERIRQLIRKGGALTVRGEKPPLSPTNSTYIKEGSGRPSTRQRPDKDW